MTNLIETKPLTKPEGHTGIYTPYNVDFVKAIKRGIPSAKWSRNLSCWYVPDRDLDDALAIARKFYPDDSEMREARITWDLSRDKPSIGGFELANVSRDSWSWRRDCPIEFKVEKESVSSGGSARNPGLYGELVIIAKIAPGMDITPYVEEGDGLEWIDKVEPVGREKLQAEIAARLESAATEDLLKIYEILTKS